ncbi:MULTISPECIES: hypothetical protein [Pandoraea]|uniref:hypothetical protein n=1 Tax=Pandoraea TaxID=93217 RepID=UPI001F5C7CD3|nr:MULTISPECIES: hypothetical protein [Pandoraea]MCI3208824.1 hypothetical protein [Pandoraea sp. LA3]MDN4586853.1 hypothetical protein [Pandoraea capi]
MIGSISNPGALTPASTVANDVPTTRHNAAESAMTCPTHDTLLALRPKYLHATLQTCTYISTTLRDLPDPAASQVPGDAIGALIDRLYSQTPKPSGVSGRSIYFVLCLFAYEESLENIDVETRETIRQFVERINDTYTTRMEFLSPAAAYKLWCDQEADEAIEAARVWQLASDEVFGSDVESAFAEGPEFSEPPAAQTLFDRIRDLAREIAEVAYRWRFAGVGVAWTWSVATSRWRAACPERLGLPYIVSSPADEARSARAMPAVPQLKPSTPLQTALVALSLSAPVSRPGDAPGMCPLIDPNLAYALALSRLEAAMPPMPAMSSAGLGHHRFYREALDEPRALRRRPETSEAQIRERLPESRRRHALQRASDEARAAHRARALPSSQGEAPDAASNDRTSDRRAAAVALHRRITQRLGE